MGVGSSPIGSGSQRRPRSDSADHEDVNSFANRGVGAGEAAAASTVCQSRRERDRYGYHEKPDAAERGDGSSDEEEEEGDSDGPRRPSRAREGTTTVVVAAAAAAAGRRRGGGLAGGRSPSRVISRAGLEEWFAARVERPAAAPPLTPDKRLRAAGSSPSGGVMTGLSKGIDNVSFKDRAAASPDMQSFFPYKSTTVHPPTSALDGTCVNLTTGQKRKRVHEVLSRTCGVEC